MNWFSDLFHWLFWEASVGLFKMFDYLLSGLNNLTPEFVANVNSDSFFTELMNKLADLGIVLIIIFLLIYMGVQFITVNHDGMKNVFKNIFYCFVFFIIISTCISGVFQLASVFGGVDNPSNEKLSVYLANAFIYEVDSSGNRVDNPVIDDYGGLPMEGQEGKDINDTIQVNGNKAYKYNYISFFFILIYCIVLYALFFFGVVKIMVHLANLLFHLLMSFFHLAKGMLYGMEALKIYGAEILRLFFSIGIQLLSFLILPHMIMVVVKMNVGIVVLLACLIGLAIFLIDGSDSLTKTLGTDNGASSPMASYLTMKTLKTGVGAGTTLGKGSYHTSKNLTQKGGNLLKKGGDKVNNSSIVEGLKDGYKNSKVDSTITKATDKVKEGTNTMKEGVSTANEKVSEASYGIGSKVGNTVFGGDSSNSNIVQNKNSNLNNMSDSTLQKNTDNFSTTNSKNSTTNIPSKNSTNSNMNNSNSSKGDSVKANTVSSGSNNLSSKGSDVNKGNTTINNVNKDTHNVNKDTHNVNQKANINNSNVNKDTSNINQKVNNISRDTNNIKSDYTQKDYFTSTKDNKKQKGDPFKRK